MRCSPVSMDMGNDTRGQCLRQRRLALRFEVLLFLLGCASFIAAWVKCGDGHERFILAVRTDPVFDLELLESVSVDKFVCDVQSRDALSFASHKKNSANSSCGFYVSEVERRGNIAGSVLFSSSCAKSGLNVDELNLQSVSHSRSRKRRERNLVAYERFPSITEKHSCRIFSNQTQHLMESSGDDYLRLELDGRINDADEAECLAARSQQPGEYAGSVDDGCTTLRNISFLTASQLLSTWPRVSGKAVSNPEKRQHTRSIRTLSSCPNNTYATRKTYIQNRSDDSATRSGTHKTKRRDWHVDFVFVFYHVLYTYCLLCLCWFLAYVFFLSMFIWISTVADSKSVRVSAFRTSSQQSQENRGNMVVRSCVLPRGSSVDINRLTTTQKSEDFDSSRDCLLSYMLASSESSSSDGPDDMPHLLHHKPGECLDSSITNRILGWIAHGDLCFFVRVCIRIK